MQKCKVHEDIQGTPPAYVTGTLKGWSTSLSTRLSRLLQVKSVPAIGAGPSYARCAAVWCSGGSGSGGGSGAASCLMARLRGSPSAHTRRRWGAMVDMLASSRSRHRSMCWNRRGTLGCWVRLYTASRSKGGSWREQSGSSSW